MRTQVWTNGKLTRDTAYRTDPESPYHNIIEAEERLRGSRREFTIGKEVVGVETEEEITYCRTDGKGSVTALLDEEGKNKAAIRYGEFGELRDPEGIATGGNLFGYTGYVYEGSTGLYDAKSRHYDAETGRFISEDSYRDERSGNRYAYAGNNPVVNTAPDGHLALEIVAIVTIIFAASAASHCVRVIVEYLISEKGQKLLRDATAVVYDGIRYKVNQFLKLIQNGWEAIKKGLKKVGKAIENFFNPSKKKEKEPEKKEKTKSKGEGKTDKEKAKTGKNKVNESDKAKRQKKKLSPEAKKGYDDAINRLEKGDTRGLNNHSLTGPRSGQRAVDIKGTGGGR